MGKETGISWTDHTFNIAFGCTKISPGCAACYADVLTKRLSMDVWGPDKPRKTMGLKYWNDPRRWNKAAGKEGITRKVFTSSMCDVFEDHPTIDAERAKLWPLIKDTPNLVWQVLTKRADRIAANLPKDWSKDNYPNVWLGVSVESADYADRVDELRKIPAVVRFISYEPALGPLDDLNLDGIHWVIYGGESGAQFRPDNLEWARVMKVKCDKAGVAFFYKQAAGLRSGLGNTSLGKLEHNFPAGALFVNGTV